MSNYLLVTEEENLQGHMVIHQGDLYDLECEPQALADNEHHHNGRKDYVALFTALFQHEALFPEL